MNVTLNENDPCRTHACNLLFRGPTPYPPGHRTSCSWSRPIIAKSLSEQMREGLAIHSLRLAPLPLFASNASSLHFEGFIFGKDQARAAGSVARLGPKSVLVPSWWTGAALGVQPLVVFSTWGQDLSGHFQNEGHARI